MCEGEDGAVSSQKGTMAASHLVFITSASCHLYHIIMSYTPVSEHLIRQVCVHECHYPLQQSIVD